MAEAGNVAAAVERLRHDVIAASYRPTEERFADLALLAQAVQTGGERARVIECSNTCAVHCPPMERANG